MRGTVALLLMVCACKAQVGDSSGTSDARAIDAPPGADLDAPDGSTGLGPWATPLQVPGASTGADEDDGTLSNDTLEMFYSLADPADNNRKHIYVTTRPNAQSMTWSAPQRASFNVDGTTDQTPRLTDDGLTLYFASNRAGTTGNLDIWQVARPAGGAWGTPVLVPGVNSAQSEKTLSPCSGNRYLLISGRGGASEDVYEGVLGAGAPALVAELSSAQSETGTFVAKDCLTMYFASNRLNATNAIYRATRAAIGPWGTPERVVDFAVPVGAQEDPWISPDLRTFMFSTSIGGNKDVYLATR